MSDVLFRLSSEYGLTHLFVERKECSTGPVDLAISGPGGGWAHYYLSESEAINLAAALIEATHLIPLVEPA